MDTRRGWQTTEFWMGAAISIVSLIIASGVWGPEDTAYKVLGFISAALASMGYSYSRAITKRAELDNLEPEEPAAE